MVFGLTLSLQIMTVGGVVMMALLIFQLASGLRWIKLPPKRRLKIHKTAGVVLVILAVVHGAMGLILATGVTIG